MLHAIRNADYLDINYVKYIDEFSTAWCKLTDSHNISTTPKVHIILHHLCDYFDDSEMTLKRVTDELVESMHQYVDKVMCNSSYKVKDVNNPQHGKLLFRAVTHVNCYNLRLKK